MRFTIRCLNTGSSGNCYLLSDESGEVLMLDAGVKSKDIKQALNYDFSNVIGVLITHSHKDHSLSADDLEKYGLDVWKPYLIEGGRDRRTFGSYAVQSFDLPHDDCPCCGFFIRHKSGFKMLYLTDCELCRYVFAKQEVNAILCECNYQGKYVVLTASNAKHKILGHMSLDACKGFIEANKTDKLHSVVICHMSDLTCDTAECVEEIEQIVPDGVVVDYAERGKEIVIYEAEN